MFFLLHAAQSCASLTASRSASLVQPVMMSVHVFDDDYDDDDDDDNDG